MILQSAPFLFCQLVTRAFLLGRQLDYALARGSAKKFFAEEETFVLPCFVHENLI